nr:hypothetical protein [Angustibacter aerolatus]
MRLGVPWLLRLLGLTVLLLGVMSAVLVGARGSLDGERLGAARPVRRRRGPRAVQRARPVGRGAGDRGGRPRRAPVPRPQPSGRRGGPAARHAVGDRRRPRRRAAPRRQRPARPPRHPAARRPRPGEPRRLAPARRRHRHGEPGLATHPGRRVGRGAARRRPGDARPRRRGHLDQGVVAAARLGCRAPRAAAARPGPAAAPGAPATTCGTRPTGRAGRALAAGGPVTRVARAVRPVALAALAAAALGGCSTQSLLGLEQNTAVLSNRAVLQPQQAVEIAGRALAQAERADAVQTTAAARTAYTGLALDVAGPTYTVAQVLDPEKDRSGGALEQYAPPSRVVVTAGRDFPRTLLAVGTPEGGPTAQPVGAQHARRPHALPRRGPRRPATRRRAARHRAERARRGHPRARRRGPGCHARAGAARLREACCRPARAAAPTSPTTSWSTRCAASRPSSARASRRSRATGRRTPRATTTSRWCARPTAAPCWSASSSGTTSSPSARAPAPSSPRGVRGARRRQACSRSGRRPTSPPCRWWRWCCRRRAPATPGWSASASLPTKVTAS